MANFETTNIPVSVELSAELGTIDTRAFWFDVLERSGKTFIQNLLIFFGAGVTIASVSWAALLGSAGLAAFVSFVLAISTATAITSGNFVIDLADRALRTGAGSLVAAIPLTGSIADINWSESLTIALTAVAVSVLTSLLTINLGSAKGLPSVAPVDSPLVLNPTGTVTEFRG